VLTYPNIVPNADDLGLSPSINRAILYCFEQGYINSTSFLTNTIYFEDTVKLIKMNPSIRNIGVHVDLAEGKPVSNFNHHSFLDSEGNWDFTKTNKKISFPKKEEKKAFIGEIFAQIEKALDYNIVVTHLDSHCHLHNLPAFIFLFIEAAKKYNLKLRPALSYYEAKPINFLYRKLVNSIIMANNNNYTDYVESISYFLENKKVPVSTKILEIVLHPDFDASGSLTDHVDCMAINKWIDFLKHPN
jgi:predicted glycoside hydrolase/deacetylase ChbG (UPF0249 family)